MTNLLCKMYNPTHMQSYFMLAQTQSHKINQNFSAMFFTWQEVMTLKLH